MKRERQQQISNGFRGFTLIELLVVVAIILILTSLLIPVLAKARLKTLRTKARADIMSLEAALSSYHDEYKRWPMGVAGNDNASSESATAGIETVDNVARMLRGENLAGQNPKRIPFYESAYTNDAGSLVDPWGRPYKYMLDYDMNSTVEILYSGTATNLPRWVAVWSRGTDGAETPEGLEDDIRSW